MLWNAIGNGTSGTLLPEVTRRKNVAENTLARRSPLVPHKCYDKNGLGEKRILEGSTSGATKQSKCRRTPDLNQPHSFRKELSQALQADPEQHSKTLAGILGTGTQVSTIRNSTTHPQRNFDHVFLDCFGF